ncbi:DNA-binding response regulator [Bacillus canaveralius]|uniref:DNA-binding response regulator n=1 Tax=Bacillus canaveralius TaxID=1403243 RepID=A0A2N5GSW5_9BACI|nr:LytTR family transcriptional regulator DNA-binding domain-containing protein [Bacillus canaveralius]PLR86860.1 DNA-binding response regulator [Bacillus canaveralius]PLR93348.1 DNA-binding response regulator [Bacillus canaveralius]
MLKAFIVDDEPLARDELAYLLLRTKKVEIVGAADSIETALKQLSDFEIDVLFLDIELGEDSGIDLAKQLVELEQRPEIVFATAYDEFALKAFELEAADYILKPFDESRVGQTVEKISKLLARKKAIKSAEPEQKPPFLERTGKLAITAEERIVLINIESILYISTAEGRTMIATDKQKYYAAEPLVTFERRLQGTPIVRVHRAFLVNLKAILEIQPWFHSTYNLMMPDGEKVPVSRTYTKELKQLLGF